MGTKEKLSWKKADEQQQIYTTKKMLNPIAFCFALAKSFVRFGFEMVSTKIQTFNNFYVMCNLFNVGSPWEKST